MRILNAVRYYVSVHYGINGESGYRFDTQFLGYVLAVTDDRSEANVQLFGDFLVDEAFGYEHKHFDFASGKIVCIHGFRLWMFASMMSMLVQLKDGLDEFFLALVDVQR